MTQTINIEVTIAQELRDLIAGRSRLGAAAEQVPLEATRDAMRVSTMDYNVNAPSVFGPVWVRRDGQRPLHFNGVQVMSFAGELEVSGLQCHQKMTLYQTAQTDHYLALTLHFPADYATRPIHDCSEIAPGTVAGVLRRWFIKAATQMRLPTATNHRDDLLQSHLPAFAAGFHALTAQCFLTEQMRAERNDLCLQ